MKDFFNLDGRVVAVTGGYGYLGKAICLGLIYHGATVWVLARDKEKFQEMIHPQERFKGKLLFCYCDISSIESIKKAFNHVYNEKGRLNVVINNAFYMSGRHKKNFDYDDWEKGMEGILSSVFWCIKEAIPYLKKSEQARIINVSSTHGITAPEKEMLKPPQYGVAKAGVIQLTKYFASYLGPDHITVNTITPGPFPSENVQKNKKYIKKLADKTLLKRIGEPQELAGSFVFLSSGASSYITGHNLVVDGGLTAS